MKKVVYALMVAVLVLSVFASAAVAATGGSFGADVNQQLAAVRQATVKYQDVQVAIDEGFVNTQMCVSVPGLGGMGVHFINLARIIDPALNITQPEILLYKPLANGMYKLVGVEYMLPVGPPDSPVPSNPPPAPYLFDQRFNGPMEQHGPGEPPHYDLHVWVWEANPVCTFAQFNPNVKCPLS